MIRIAICDDDEEYNDKLKKMLSAYLHSKHIKDFELSEYTSGDSLIAKFVAKKYDFIFLDIEMPGSDGFSTAGKIRDIDFDVDIVFVTYAKESIQRGFDYNAKGYLYKEVTQEQINERMDKLVGERLRNREDSFLKVKLTKGGTVLISLSRVQYFESTGHYISVVSEDETHTFIDTITKLSEELESKGFVRVSRSHIVNMNYVFNLTGNKITIIKGDDITVGRSYKQILRKALEKRVVGKWKT
ncbi:MAG: LytTR family DNA-binding domain-containing protein [Oscillospiraceae bacterium]|nr:LytTR family DNA-binding domain-containing protein [Oscillospiraceae bacterium]